MRGAKLLFNQPFSLFGVYVPHSQCFIRARSVFRSFEMPEHLFNWPIPGHRASLPTLLLIRSPISSICFKGHVISIWFANYVGVITTLFKNQAKHKHCDSRSCSRVWGNHFSCYQIKQSICRIGWSRPAPAPSRCSTRATATPTTTLMSGKGILRS